MTKENQIIAIAVASKQFRDGWKQEGLLVGHRMTNGQICNLPEYPDDQNAIHEAVKAMSSGRYVCWCILLEEKLGAAMALNASAADKSECYLKAMDLWETPAGLDSENA